MLDRALPALVLAGAVFYLLQSVQLPFGSAARPGAGFYPVVIATFACVVGLVTTAVSFVGRRPEPERATAVVDPAASTRRRRVLITTAALLFFCVVMPWVGYPLAAAAFGVATLVGLGSRWWAATSIGVVSAAGSYYLFAVLLDVPLPRGPW
jgi:putative tricarboxylic transport membrane protein